MSTELLLEGRIVAGHPMKANQRTDDAGKPRFKVDGSPMLSFFVALAIPKNGTTDWKQTSWGADIYAQAQADWKNNETAMPSFSWKIVDGDSTVPNKNNVQPCTKEGYPGHWVVSIDSNFPYSCHHPDKYAPIDQIKDENVIKCGDYGRMMVSVVGNGATGTNTRGIYINPQFFILDRAGDLINTGSSVDVAAKMAALMGGAVSQPQVQPAHDIVDNAGTPPPPPAGEEKRTYQGKAYTRGQLANWTDAQWATLPIA